MRTQNKGFTLIELSIVLVIVGLIVAGVIGGQSIIRSAKLRSVITDINGFKTAIMVYEDYYDALPGDHINAGDYYGLDCENPISACNGNGNGKIEWNQETQHVWEHLNLSEILQTDADESGSSVSEKYPTSNIGEGRYLFGSAGTASLVPVFGRTGLHFSLGASAGSSPVLATINAPDAQSIDKKMDDGLASEGDVRTSNDGFTASGCVDAAVSASLANYTMSNTDILCHMYFFYE